MAARQRGDQVRICEWFNQMHPITIAQNFADRFLNLRIQMHGVEQMHVIISQSDIAQGQAQIPKRLPEALASMRSYEDQASIASR